jgi:hypothetical protein
LGALVTWVAATKLPAPGLFSITTGVRSVFCISSATRRAVTSVAPPGAKGTTSVIGLDGNSCARAGRAGDACVQQGQDQQRSFAIHFHSPSKPEHGLGHDVALDLRRPTIDRLRPAYSNKPTSPAGTRSDTTPSPSS